MGPPINEVAKSRECYNYTYHKPTERYRYDTTTISTNCQINYSYNTSLTIVTLVGGLEHFYFSIYWQFQHPK